MYVYIYAYDVTSLVYLRYLLLIQGGGGGGWKFPNRNNLSEKLPNIPNW